MGRIVRADLVDRAHAARLESVVTAELAVDVTEAERPLSGHFALAVKRTHLARRGGDGSSEGSEENDGDAHGGVDRDRVAPIQAPVTRFRAHTSDFGFPKFYVRDFN